MSECTKKDCSKCTIETMEREIALCDFYSTPESQGRSLESFRGYIALLAKAKSLEVEVKAIRTSAEKRLNELNTQNKKIKELQSKLQAAEEDNKSIMDDLDKTNIKCCGLLSELRISEAENKELSEEIVQLIAANELLKEQQPPCSSTCYHHQTHPCEQCGKINGYPLVWKNNQFKAQLDKYRWIPVTERYPEERKDLVPFRSEDVLVVVGKSFRRAYYMTRQKYWRFYHLGQPQPVTHWKDIIPPPEQSEGKK